MRKPSLTNVILFSLVITGNLFHKWGSSKGWSFAGGIILGASIATLFLAKLGRKHFNRSAQKIEKIIADNQNL